MQPVHYIVTLQSKQPVHYVVALHSMQAVHYIVTLHSMQPLLWHSSVVLLVRPEWSCTLLCQQLTHWLYAVGSGAHAPILLSPSVGLPIEHMGFRRGSSFSISSLRRRVSTWY